MSKKTRYLLLLAGFIFFLILAPLAVLYVRGLSYDFASKSFVQTGILAVNMEPKNASVFLNDKLKRTGSGDIKFLLPGEYNVSLKKDGYFTWSKRLEILEGQVTWASPANSNIYLFLSNPQSNTISGNVLDFYTNNSLLAFLTSKQTFVVSNGSTPNTNDVHNLPKPVNTILTSDGNKNFILADSSGKASTTILSFNLDTGVFSDLTGLFTATPKFEYAGNGDLYALSNQNLYKVDTAFKTKIAVLKNIQTFYFQKNDLYYISQNNGQASLNLNQAPYNQSQQLLNNLPQFNSGELFVNFSKEILLLADGNLYKANSVMQKISGNVSKYNFSPSDGTFSVYDSGEFSYYSPGEGALSFITRSGESLQNLAVKNNIGYAFYSNANGVNAIELDSRDNQNHYNLYSSSQIKKFTLDSSGQNIIVLDGSDLKTLQIR